MKNRVFSILLFLCFIAPAATTFVFLRLQKNQVRKEVKRMMLAGIDKNELVLLKFTEEEKQNKLHWKHSKEFEFKGEMYDIVESRVVGDTTFYWVWWDHEETKLSKQLKELVISDLNHNPKNQDYRKKLHNFYKFLFFEEYRPDKPFVITEEKNVCLTKNKLYHSHSLSPPAPPPEIYP